MSSQTTCIRTPISPNDPRLHTVEEEPSFSKQQSKALYALGYDSRAERLELCSTYWRWLRRANCNPWAQNAGRCGLRSCVNCAYYDARMNLRKYGPLGATKLVADDIIFLEWTDTEDWTPEIGTNIDRKLTRLRRMNAGKLMVTNRGAFVRRSTVRAVYGGPDTSFMLAVMKQIFPTAHVRVRPKSDWENVLALVFDPHLSQDPDERAYIEHMFNHVRQLRISGITKGQLEVYGGKSYTTNCQVLDPRTPCPECGEPCIKTVPACPCCGKPPDEVSQWLTRAQKADDSTELKWSRVLPYDPGAHPKHH